MNRCFGGALSALVLWGIVAITAAADAVSDANSLTNSMCPVTTDEPVDPDVFAVYGERKVYFCCPKCRRKFLRSPETYAGLLAQVTATSGDQHHETTESSSAVNPREENAATGTLAKDHDHDGHAAHDHATGHGQPVGLPRLVRWLGKLHPVVVHFPIALLLAAALAELLTLLTGVVWLRAAGRFCVLTGGVSALTAAVLGWAAWGFAHYPDDMSWVITSHRWLGSGTAVLAAATAVLSELGHREHGAKWLPWYRWTLFLTAVLVGVAGHFGGMLVFGTDHYQW